MRRIMKLAAVGAMAAGLLGVGAPAALAGNDTDVVATEAVQCVGVEEALGAGLLIGLGANVDLANSAACTGSVNVNDND